MTVRMSFSKNTYLNTIDGGKDYWTQAVLIRWTWLCYRKQTIDFDVCKRNLLLKLQKELDKSKKGSVDEPIAELVEYINQTKDYCTTSSCSGRFAIFCAKYDDQKEEQISVELLNTFITTRKEENGSL